MIKAVIFDMDGVIVDSEPIESLAWEKILAEYGIKPIFNKTGLIHLIGKTSLEWVMEKHSLNEDPQSIRVKKRKIFGELVIKNLVPKPGFTKLFKLLQKHKFKLALSSNRFEEHVLLIADKLKIRESFHAIIGNNDKRATKPAPDIFLETAEKLMVEPKYCLVIEDSEHGIAAAKRAGMKVIAVPNKWTADQNFSKADKVLQSLSEITMEMLESLEE
jgi:HAD superfamily hydrolase (TIGR01509 family)